jgi:hypothetical protein
LLKANLSRFPLSKKNSSWCSNSLVVSHAQRERRRGFAPGG